MSINYKQKLSRKNKQIKVNKVFNEMMLKYIRNVNKLNH